MFSEPLLDLKNFFMAGIFLDVKRQILSGQEPTTPGTLNYEKWSDLKYLVSGRSQYFNSLQGQPTRLR